MGMWFMKMPSLKVVTWPNQEGTLFRQGFTVQAVIRVDLVVAPLELVVQVRAGDRAELISVILGPVSESYVSCCQATDGSKWIR